VVRRALAQDAIRAVLLRWWLVFTIRDGLIARKDTYIDGLSFQRQVGLGLAATATP
jgi:hypothetical protein